MMETILKVLDRALKNERHISKAFRESLKYSNNVLDRTSRELRDLKHDTADMLLEYKKTCDSYNNSRLDNAIAKYNNNVPHNNLIDANDDISDLLLDLYDTQKHMRNTMDDLSDVLMDCKEHNEHVKELVSPVRKVARRANPGEWVKVVKAFGGSAHKNGDILNICDPQPNPTNGAYYKNKAGCYLYDSEYVVLENYVPKEDK